MKNRIKNFLNNIPRLKIIDNRVKTADSKINDIYSLEIIQSLISQGSYLPLNSGALRPLGIAFILNEIIINKRTSILEFGSGFSTIMTARLAKRNNLDLKIFSVEHDPKWGDLIIKILIKERLDKYVTIITAELKADNDNSIWYDKMKIDSIIQNQKFDFVIVDGPPAYSKDLLYARMPVQNFIIEKMNESFCILIDDSNRNGEKKLINELTEKFSETKLISVGDTITALYKGNYFYSSPF